MANNSSGIPAPLVTVRGLTIASYDMFGRLGFIGLALLLFLSALASETLKTTPGESATLNNLGISVLVFGWIPETNPPLVGTLAWLSNPEFIVALVFVAIGQFRIARIISVVSLLGGTFTFLISGVTTINQSNGDTVPVIGYGAGVYLWFLSLGVPLLAANFLALIPKAVPK